MTDEASPLDVPPSKPLNDAQMGGAAQTDEEFWLTAKPETIYVSFEAFDWLLEFLEKPSTPHPRLKRLFEEYRG